MTPPDLVVGGRTVDHEEHSVPTVHWAENHTDRRARWHSENRTPAPDRVVTADDRLKADTAHRLVRDGTALLWRGDYPNARQLLRALARRIDRTTRSTSSPDPAEAFHRHRQARARRARLLGGLLVLLEDDYRLRLRRAPDVRQACIEAYGPASGPVVVSLTELLGVIGAHEWRRKGVAVPTLADHIHPHYGVFSPVRGEYVDLVADAPLPLAANRSGTAFDLGTGTGVLAAVLARRGVGRVVATDSSRRARECARDNLDRLGLSGQVQVAGPDLFPSGRADLIVCNPPWIPARPTSAVEQGVYDPDGAMLYDFLTGLTAHLGPGAEAWLILSDLAERLGLRPRDGLPARFAAAGLRVVDRIDTRPVHRRARDTTDPLHAARSGEVTSLWRLEAAES